MESDLSYVGTTALCTFIISVFAAALAINLYSLYRTGRMGASWRVMIIATVMFALLQAVKLAEVFSVPVASELHLSSLIELAFVITLLYAFHLQRQVFNSSHRPEPKSKKEDEEDGIEEISSHERYS